MFRTKLFWIGALFLGLTCLTGGLAYWVSDRSSYYLERSRLAHTVHKEYLRLSTQTIALFKQMMDTLVANPTSDQPDLADIRQQIENTLDVIRKLIAAEVAFVDATEREDEQNELMLLAQIERQIQSVLSEFHQFRNLNVAVPLKPDELEMLRGCLRMSLLSFRTKHSEVRNHLNQSLIQKRFLASGSK